VIEFSGTNVFRAVEHYYAQSEQRLARLFRYSEEDIVMISSQPDCDESWLAALTVDDVRELDQKEKLGPLERRQYVWECGCSTERLYPVLARLTEEDLDHAFGSDEFITLTCPRCGARHRAAREQFEAWREEHAKG
jgi:molecular chaperone Hsp33